MTAADRQKLARLQARLEALERDQKRKEHDRRIERTEARAAAAPNVFEHATALSDLAELHQ